MTDARLYDRTEIFGPVLTVIRAKTFEQALAIINDNPYGNGASIFTSSAVVARKFEKNVLAGQVGVNVPIVNVSHHASGS